MRASGEGVPVGLFDQFLSTVRALESLDAPLVPEHGVGVDVAHDDGFGGLVLVGTRPREELLQRNIKFCRRFDERP
jgi:hypothetical protein